MPENDSNEYHVRLQKLKDIREKGHIPYYSKYERSHNAAEALEKGEQDKLRTVEDIIKKKSKETIKLAGRLVAFRSHGKLSFGQLQDFFGKIQVCFMQDVLGKDDYKFLKKIDIADYLGLEGELFETRHGEITLMVYKYTLLSKALRPLPEKWHGIKDQEQIYRQRFLDTTMNRESLDRFIFRSNLVKAMRQFYWSKGFYEIESPTLENVSSGTTAKPFITHHNALDIDVYLRIAGGEIWHKMAVIGGFEKVFELGKCFRNEGMDPSHLQEFTMVEHYAAYWDFEENMKFTEELFAHIITELTGSTKVKVKDREGKEVEVDFKAPLPRVKFVEIIEKDCGINILDYFEDEEALLKEIKKKKIMIEDADKMGYGNLCDALYKKVSRPKLIQPCFVTMHPISTKPLARKNDEDPRLCDTYQMLVNTWEVVNAYSELVDPVDQRERFEQQALARAKGDEDAMMINEEYIEAMEHGMPNMSGCGIGIDRLVALLTRQDNLKDTVLFPLLRPSEEARRKENKAMEKAKKIVRKSKKNG